MKIDIASDIHLEFTHYPLDNSDSDVLILGGDTFVTSRYADVDKYRKFMIEASSIYPDIIFIMGNHEYYYGEVDSTLSLTRHFLSEFPNVHLLERQSIKINDVTFIGGTMWTDMNDYDVMTMARCVASLNDFKVIKQRVNHEEVAIYPEFFIEEFNSFVEYVSNQIIHNEDEKYVVCTHHCPSRQSTPKEYENNYELNGGFSSNLDSFISQLPQIKLWTHGHTHFNFDYTIGGTRIICNPRGYVVASDKDNYKIKTVEI